MIKEKLLSILACPTCKKGLTYSNKPLTDDTKRMADINILNEEFLVCSTCHSHFQIQDDIPIMIIKKT